MAVSFRTGAIVRHLWIAPILMLGVWLRFAGLGAERLYGDEAEYAIVARYLSRDWLYLAYPDITGMGAVPFVSQPPLMLYLMAIAMKVMGPTDIAAILPAALLGAATVAVVYALGCRLGGRFMGASSALVLAALPFHIEMSRRAMLDAGFVFFLLLTGYFLVAWMQDRSRTAAIGVGLAAAATCLAKLPGILVLPVVVLAFAYVLAIAIARRGDPSAPALRETAIQGGLGALPVVVGGALYVALLAYLSAIGDLWVKLRWQLGRVDTTQAQTQELAATPRDMLWYFTDDRFSFGVLLGQVVFALALVGLIVALVRLGMRPARQSEHLVVPLTALVLLGFFLFSDRKEGFYLLPFAPLACLCIGYAGDGLRRMLAWAGLRAAPSSAARMAPAALAMGLVLIAVPALGAARDSWSLYGEGESQEKYFGGGSDEAALWIHEQDPEAGQYGTLLGRWAIHWYNEHETYHWYIDHTYIESQIESGELRYVVFETYLKTPFDREYMKELIHKYNGREVASFSPTDWGRVQVFELNP